MKTRYDEIQEKWWGFHYAHPEVWRLFEKFTFDRIERGFKHYSAKGVFERIRWETAQAEVGANEFKLNNNYSAFYARLFMEIHPEHDGFFRTRVQTSTADYAIHRPELTPRDFAQDRF